MPNPTDLVSPSGQPLIREPSIVVIKTPRNRPPFHPDFIRQISIATKCDTIILPMDSEFLMGSIAVKEIESIHHGIHNILRQPDVVFSQDEVKLTYAALRYLCEKTSPGDSSKEVTLLKKIKAYIE